MQGVVPVRRGKCGGLGSFFKVDASRGSIQTESYVDGELERIEKKYRGVSQALEEADAADEKAGKQDTSDDKVLSVQRIIAFSPW